MSRPHRLPLLALLAAVLVLPGLTGFAYASRCGMRMNGSERLAMHRSCCSPMALQCPPSSRPSHLPSHGNGGCMLAHGCATPQWHGSVRLVLAHPVTTPIIPSEAPALRPPSPSLAGLWRPPRRV